MRIRARIFAGSLLTAAAGFATALTVLLGARTPDGGVEPLLAAAALAAGAVVAVAGASGTAWLASRAIRRRGQEIAASARRSLSGSQPSFERADREDEVGIVAQALDDVTRELRQRMAEIAGARARMEAMLSGMVEGVLIVGPEGRVQLANEAARRMLLLSGAVEGRHYLELIRHPAIAESIAAALEGRPSEGRDLTLGRQPGRTFFGRAAPVAAARERGAVLVLHDVTELRQADQMRRDFVANVSHELRTPLTAIRGYVEALREEGVEPAQAQQFLEVIGRHADRMERLVRDLLRLARLDAGQESLDVRWCDLDPLLADVLSEVDRLRQSKRQEIRLSPGTGAIRLRADCTKLHEVIRNLVENALNYSPESTVIEIGAERAGASVQLTVKDRGPGIPDQDRTRIFERFYRVDQGRSVPGGTGLGLSIVKHLVELHGGQVSVARRSGGGSIFTVSLPVREAAEDAAAQDRAVEIAPGDRPPAPKEPA